MNVCLCVSLHNVHILVCVEVCAFVCGVVLPFPALGMFKASSWAVRMCLSLFSKNTCSAFYQRAELGRPGAVQGWARIIKHQQILIHPDWNWLGLFAGLVWLGLVGHGGITVLECGGLVLLRDRRLFVVRLNWSWYWISKDGDIPRSVLIYQVSYSLSYFLLHNSGESVCTVHLCVCPLSHVHVLIRVW